MKMAGFAIGFLLGWLSSVPVFLYFQEPTAEEAGRTYMAYGPASSDPAVK